MHSLPLHSLGSPHSAGIQQYKVPVTVIETAQVQFKYNDPALGVACSLPTAIKNGDSKLGSCIHAKILKSGLDSNSSVTNSLLDMYTKCCRVEDGSKVFEELPDWTIESWTMLMSGYCKEGFPDKAISLFWQMSEALHVNEYALAVLVRASCQIGDRKLLKAIHGLAMKGGFITDTFLKNSLLSAYAKCGMLVAAEKLLEASDSRDVVSWTSVISGCLCSGRSMRAVVLFILMIEDGILPNEVTILSILRACSSINDEQIFGWIHGLIIKAEWCSNALVVNSLVEMYRNNGYFEEGIKIFCCYCFAGEGLYLTPETLATFVQGCAQSGSLKLGQEVHGYLVKHGFFPCNIIENSLINMYAEYEQDDYALQLFTKMSCKDIISWNTMMAFLIKRDRSSEALTLLTDIHSNEAHDNVFPDFVTMLASIQACSKLASLQLGEIIHAYMIRTGLIHDMIVQNCLIDFYAKSGKLELAEKIFRNMFNRDLGSWNSIIAAYGINGHGTSALQIFSELTKSGTYHPNEITFVNLLSACARTGLVEEGHAIFRCMKRDFNVEPRMEHYACMVDILGRSGELQEALAFIERMPLRSEPDVWGALLGACLLFGDVEIAERAAMELSVLQAKSEIWMVALSNVYAGVSRWKDGEKIRAEMRGPQALKKEAGWSSVEVRGHAHIFILGDTKHPESETIYEALNRLHAQIRVPILNL